MKYTINVNRHAMTYAITQGLMMQLFVILDKHTKFYTKSDFCFHGYYGLILGIR